MAYIFRLPAISEGLTEVVVVQWLVAVGEHVEVDAPLVEIETNEALTTMPSPAAGTVLHHGAAEGEVLPVGEVLAVIGEPGEEWAAVAEPEVAPIVGTLSGGTELRIPQQGAQVEALPAVRRLAREKAVDLSAIAGTGPGGRITVEDVEAAHGGGGLTAFTPTRRSIADHMSRSWREIPHVTTFDDAAAVHILEARRRLLSDQEGPAPLEALLIKAVIPALVGYPEFNATVSEQGVILKEFYDIGVAVDTPDGLVVGVVRAAREKTVPELSDEVIRLAKSARNRKLTTGDVGGATFTVSNIGAVGGRYGTPIIPYGTTAILSVGRARPEAVVRSGNVVAELRIPLSLSCDHRAIDGALGRRFLAAVIDEIESGSFE